MSPSIHSYLFNIPFFPLFGLKFKVTFLKPALNRKPSETLLKAQYMPGEMCVCLSEIITDSQIESGQLKADLKETVIYTLLRKHRHQTKKSNLRSLADIGKSVSSASRLFGSQENGNTAATSTLSLTLYRFPHLSSRFQHSIYHPSIHQQHLSLGLQEVAFTADVLWVKHF